MTPKYRQRHIRPLYTEEERQDSWPKVIVNSIVLAILAWAIFTLGAL